jgi:multidrug resistance efflux pump
MSAWHPVSEEERARATLTRCEGQLRQAREQGRRADEVLKKTLRGIAEAEDALAQATRRLDRSARVGAADAYRL